MNNEKVLRIITFLYPAKKVIVVIIKANLILYHTLLKVDLTDLKPYIYAIIRM